MLTRLLVLTDRRASPRPLLRRVTEAVEAGARAIVLREKDLPDGERRVLAESLAVVLEPVDGSLLMAGHCPSRVCSGHHLGAEEPWHRHGSGLVGRSCHDEEEVLRAVKEGCDYLTVSPVHETPSKPGYGPPLGVENLRRLVDAAGDVPVFALGGVGPGNAAACVGAGAHGVAVMGEVMRATCARSVVRDLLDAVGEAS